ncbi:MAG TPA: zinc-ribbon domain-containing protein [Actinocrinis sp.]|nr:zinc-ribbon domain-containing protein [Actinocrinis sp.]
MGEAKFCRNCGTPVLPQDVFCPECGQSIRREAAPAGQPAGEQPVRPDRPDQGVQPSPRRHRAALVGGLVLALGLVAAGLLAWPGHMLRSENAADTASGPWRAVSADAVKLQVPQGWKTSAPPTSDPTVRLVAYGPAQSGYPQTHLVLRADSAPVATRLTTAVAAYEHIGRMRHPTETWDSPKSVSVPGAKTAVEVTGSFRLGDNPGGNLVHTLDIFAAKDDGVPVHVYAVGAPDQISPDFIQRLAGSLNLRP